MSDLVALLEEMDSERGDDDDNLEEEEKEDEGSSSEAVRYLTRSAKKRENTAATPLVKSAKKRAKTQRKLSGKDRILGMDVGEDLDEVSVLLEDFDDFEPNRNGALVLARQRN